MGFRRTAKLIAVAIAGIQRAEALQPRHHNAPTCAFHSASEAFLVPTCVSSRSAVQNRRPAERFALDTDPGKDGDDEQSNKASEPGRIHDDREDHTTVHEEYERESIEYIDKQLLQQSGERTADNGGAGEQEADKDNYFNWDRVRDNRNMTSDEVVKSVDSTGMRELEKGPRPTLAGRGTDMRLNIEDFPTNVDTGRLNEWVPSWHPGEKVMSFFPILIDQYSLLPSPLQLGFEDPVVFRGKYVDMTFNSLIDNVAMPDGSTKQIYGMCFINPNSGQLAPLAVYAELLSREAFVDGGGERLKVKGRVLGRVLLHQVVMEEPFIKAKIIPMEDDPKFTELDEVPKLVDEITSLHDMCNKVECEMMELMGQHYAVARIKSRPELHDVIDQRLDHFDIDLATGAQAFAQIAAYTAFDFHLTADERYDALTMQNSIDRLRYVRDSLRSKLKQLNILKKAPRDRLEDILEQMKQMQLNREEAAESVANEGDQNGDE
ncbi:hypothetical protein, conserved [Babesia bigemina]|uniref:Lon N-terminal domain-containing protein n=1 Tax=Babesia bigemina TaxID=5866 RepID=A0A061DCQ8_BABBI|nr:hypothetical protein, conserved [Babesia bigemina]CDR95715.1 hypothetical protein, conserved [Babesia bigemina]|eukprot:XP_012767901.1 hypothetical protein, conserved [Babesia bigemina]